MAERDDHDEQLLVLHCANDPVVTNANPQTITTPETLRARWAWVHGQERDRPPYSSLMMAIDLLQCAEGSRAEFDPVTQGFTSLGRV